MNYEIIFAPEAELGLSRLYKNEPKAYQKALKLIAELHVHLRSGTGNLSNFRVIERGNGVGVLPKSIV